MWIKIQGENNLLKCTHIVQEYPNKLSILQYSNEEDFITLGKYETIERSDEVMREIRHYIEQGKILYEMPWL